MARAQRSPRTRTFDSAALTAFAPVIALVPAWALAIAVFWWITLPLHGSSYGFFALIAFLSGVVLFLKPTQKLILRRLLGARTPTRSERDQIQRAWLVVAQASRIPANTFVLAVADADDVNAFACGGHLMVVSSFALEQLTHDELVGVLAHELSHHLGSHTVALTFGQWLSIPIIILAQVGFALQNVARAASETIERRSTSLSLIGKTIAIVLNGVSWIFRADLLLAQGISNIVGKGAEFKADANAVDLGFGKELSSALRQVIARGHGERPSNWRDRIVTAHPPARTRVARIDARLRQQAQRRSR